MSTQAIAADALRGTGSRRAAASFWADALWRLRHDPTTMAAFGVLAALVVLALLADVLAEQFFKVTLSQQDLFNTYRKPTLDEPAFWFGTDNLGRSVIVRLLYGGRVSLFIGAFGALVSLTVGIVLGLSAGYFRGWWDDLVVWLVATIAGVPRLYLLLIVGFLFRLDPLSLAVFIGLLGWLGVCNLARGQTFSLRERDYVTAARTIGASQLRIMFRHIFPNIVPLMIVIAMIDVGGIILAESALSYLGFGIQPPTPSWGNMLSGAIQFYYKGTHVILFPGIAITLTVLCLYLIGDGLRDALDPRLRGSFGAKAPRV